MTDAIIRTCIALKNRLSYFTFLLPYWTFYHSKFSDFFFKKKKLAQKLKSYFISPSPSNKINNLFDQTLQTLAKCWPEL